MQKRIQIGLVGDFDEKIHTLVALNESIEHTRRHLPFEMTTTWIPTPELQADFPASQLYDGFWIVPGSPYQHDEGVYALIRWARENNFPLLGTCGGFQYMLVEYARNVLGIGDAGHEESNADAEQLIITKLHCSLKGQREEVIIQDKKSLLFEALGTEKITAHYYCSYGLNKTYQKILEQYPLIFTAHNSSGEPRAFELRTHRFYMGTLFQPSLDSSFEKPNALIKNFITKCISN